MKTSIIVLTFNGLELNKKCIDSVLKNTEGDFELIIVDNGSTDGTVSYLNSLEDKRIEVILNNENRGFAKGNNQGAKKASGETLVFLNNDTEATKNWLPPLKKAIEEKDVGIAGSKLLYPDGKIQHAGVAFSPNGMPRHVYRRFGSDFPPANKERELQAVTGACFAIKKDLFNQVGGFDEHYINGLEDIDLCFKVRDIGLKIMYVPESVAIHSESISKDRFKYYFRNREHFLKKWPHIETDEDKIYHQDGFGKLFIIRQHINNRYLTGNYLGKAKTALKKLLGKQED